MIPYLDELVEDLVDEDERDEGREDLLSEAGEMLDEEAAFKHDDEGRENTNPQVDPQSHWHVLQTHLATYLVQQTRLPQLAHQPVGPCH